jgi:hypothetical protein
LFQCCHFFCYYRISNPFSLLAGYAKLVAAVNVLQAILISKVLQQMHVGGSGAFQIIAPEGVSLFFAHKVVIGFANNGRPWVTQQAGQGFIHVYKAAIPVFDGYGPLEMIDKTGKYLGQMGGKRVNQ